VRFWFGRKGIIVAVDQQDGHRQPIDAIPHVEVVDDRQYREFIHKRPQLYLTELLLDQVARETGTFRDRAPGIP